MKAILVLDEMPKKCGDCKLFMNNGNSYWCVKTGCDTTSSSMPNNCPLKPMPQKENTFEKGLDEYGTGWRIGFNACIDEILGEEE